MRFPILPLSLAFLGIIGCAASPDGSAPPADGALNGTGDVEPHNLPIEVDFASWVQGADDFIEGTVAEVRAAWSPLVGSREVRVDADDCVMGAPAIDLVLTDLRSVQGASLPSLTVRAAFGGLLDGMVGPDVEVGEEVVSAWHGPEPTFAVGMRVGGPIYHNPGHADPVFPTGISYPIYRIVDGEAQFFVKLTTIGTPYEDPQVEHLQGLSATDLWAEVVQASAAAHAPLASAYRQYAKFDDGSVWFHYAGWCDVTTEQAAAQQPCLDTGDVCP